MMVQFGDTIYLKAETKREEDEEGFILYVYNINTRTCRPYNSNNSNKQNITFPKVQGNKEIHFDS